MSDAREWLERHTEAHLRPVMDALFMRDALLAVLDLHVAANYDGDVTACYVCETDSWPCATLRAINKALGVTDE